ncbi:MAG: alpha-amylase family glycosyl hydrolase [Chloroflexota bacterium]|nr:alpha-amylase family glycosyl hydrolase [Chloroflexota bacterium]
MADAWVWWKHGVIYQIYPRSFQDSNGDGIGDLPGILARLDHLNDGTDRSLGIDAIWLSPFYRSPMADFGYDVSDHRDVDPIFGTLADFDRLLAAAHERGIRVVVDLVPNHTSEQHPWFVESRSGRTNPRRDWYVWADPARGGGPPNNWRSTFPRVGRAWTLDPHTRQYYLHHFLPQQPDLNWWDHRVRQAIDEVMRFWLDRGVDGFRVDVAHGLLSDEALRNNPRLTLFGRRRRRDVDLEEVHEIHRAWRRTLDDYDDRMAVGEVFLTDLRRLVRYYGEDDELQLSFNFMFLSQPWSATRFRRAVERYEALLPRHAWPDYTLSNHDRPRAASRYGLRNAATAALMLLTLRGTPFVYYGEEIGMTDVPIAAERVVDIDGRDPERTPMRWDGSPNAGFTTGDPWLSMGDDADPANVAAQRDDERSLLSFYRRVMRTRRGSAALRWGTYRSLQAPRGVFAYAREQEGERLAVALNFTDDERAVTLPWSGSTARVIHSTHPERDGAGAGSPLRLAPNEGVLVSAP